MTGAAVLSLALLVLSSGPMLAEEATVAQRMVDDRKAVIATVEPVHELVARARIGGTIASLTIKEGDQVADGDRIAVVADQKLALQMQALNSRIASQQSQRDQAKIDFDRAQELRRRRQHADPSSTRPRRNLDVAERTLQRCAPIAASSSSRRAKGRCWRRSAGRVLKRAGPRRQRRFAGRDDRDHRRQTITSCACNCPSATHNSCAKGTRS